MTIVVSFDVGITNLAYCVVASSETQEPNENVGGAKFEILAWEVIDLKASSLEDGCRKMSRCLADRASTLTAADVVVIERQTSTNVRMKILSHVIQTFFDLYHVLRPSDQAEFRAPKVEFFSPKHKLKVYTGPEIVCTLANRYRYNKKVAVEQTTAILKKYPVHMQYFHSLRKKDDAADSFLQALARLFGDRQQRCSPPEDQK